MFEIIIMKTLKSTSFFLAILLLFYSSGFSFTIHFCKDQIAAVSSVFSDEVVCEMPEVSTEKKCCVSKKSCCHDVSLSLKDASTDTIVKVFTYAISTPFLAASFISIPKVESQIQITRAQIQVEKCSNAPPFYILYSQNILYA